MSRKRREAPMNNQEKISVDTTREILDRVEAVKSLVIGFMGALHEVMENSSEDEVDPGIPKTFSAAGFFVFDKKILMNTFGYAISEEFINLKRYIEKLETHD